MIFCSPSIFSNCSWNLKRKLPITSETNPRLISSYEQQLKREPLVPMKCKVQTRLTGWKPEESIHSVQKCCSQYWVPFRFFLQDSFLVWGIGIRPSLFLGSNINHYVLISWWKCKTRTKWEILLGQVVEISEEKLRMQFHQFQWQLQNLIRKFMTSK